jgi:hypothetical protein
MDVDERCPTGGLADITHAILDERGTGEQIFRRESLRRTEYIHAARRRPLRAPAK